MGSRGLVSKLGTFRRVRARVYASMHVESAVVHVCALPRLLCVSLWAVFQTLNGGKKKDFISIIWMLTFRSGQS